MLPKLTFVHISDTHLGPTPDYLFHGHQSALYLDRLVALINAFPQPPDFVIHTGDLSTDRSMASYAVAREVLAELRVPIYFVGGNHDDPGWLRHYFAAPPHPSGDPAAPLVYTFEVKGERFLVLDGCSPDVPDPLGKLNDEQLALVRSEAVPDGPPLTLMLHYPLFPMGSPWLDENMLLVNGADLHAALLPARGRLRGVFFGHLHRSCQLVRDGITYTCAGSGVMGYAWRPWDLTPQIDDNFLPSYNVVQFFDGYTLTQQYIFPSP